MRSGPAVVRPVGPLLLGCALLLAPRSGRCATAAVEPDVVPAAGRSTATLTITEPGRYAVLAASAAGAALQLVDRLAGPGEVSGAAGGRDGRVDALLDRGTYQIVTRGPETAGGDVRLQVRPFVDPEPLPQALLVEGKEVAAALGDFEQRSWWLRVDAARRVVLEAAGRSLGDLRLFRDGGWLVDAAPVRERIEPEPGRPLRSCRIAAVLEPGLYRLTAFGGPDEPWPAGGDGRPLHLRFGVPTLGDAGRTRYRVGPFGADHFVLPGRVTFVRIELPGATDATLTEAPFPEGGDPFGDPRMSAAVTKKSREPAATLEPHAQRDPRLVTVRAAPGQPYVLQHFELRDRYQFGSTGDYWIGSVHSGDPQDAADATAIVTRDAARHVVPALSQTVEIGAERGWARRCNLLDTLTVFFRVRDTATYEVLLRGDAAARARFEPFLLDRPRDYREPDLEPSGSTWGLEQGWYVLTVVPDKPGIVEVAVRAAGALDAVWDLLDPGRAMQAEPVRPAVTFPSAELVRGGSYTVHLNRRPGVRSGLVVRQLPIDVANPLPLALVPGEQLAVPARVAEAGTLRVEDESGADLDIRVGEGPWLTALDVDAGTHDVRVRNGGAASVTAALRFDARRLRDDTPLPPLPAGALLPPPVFPKLVAGESRFLDLARGGTATYAVQVAEPAFHTVESTGLLATAGTLRSRLIPSLAAADGGGTGRNFLVGSYLGEGEYQLTVAAQGGSRGHLGLRLRRAPLRDGGALREGVPARVSGDAAEGALHTFDIAEAGTYRLAASALGRRLRCRLEDAGGWPIATPGAPAAFEQRFEPGRYRLLLLPEAVGSRRVTLLERLADPPRFEGHGPHPLELDRAVEHVWVEPGEDAGDAGRTPDRWVFALPAPATLKVALTGEMQGEIRRRADPPEAEPLARIRPGRPWSGRLETGAYVLATVCSRRNNHNRYEVAIAAEELLAGTSRDVVAPATIPVSVGATGLFEFETVGAADVRARLVDAAGAAVAEQEDRPDDWNVQLAARLAPGAYRLELSPTGAEAAPTRVALRALGEREDPPLAVPASREVRPDGAIAVVPLALPAAGTLLVVRASADETVGLAVDGAGGGEWTTLQSSQGRRHAVELPLPADADARQRARYRLRLWSLDRRGAPIRVAVSVVTPPRVTESDLARGIAIAPVAGSDPPIAAAEIALDRPGLVGLDPAAPWRVSGAAHRPLAAAAPAGVVAAPAGTLWVAADGAGGATLAGRRVALGVDAPLTVDLPADATPVSCDLQTRGGGPVVVTVSAATGRPAVSIASRGGTSPPPVSATGTAAAGEHAAATIAGAADRSVALVWHGDAARPSSQATLRLLEPSAGPAQDLPAGASGGVLERRGARRFALPRGDKRVSLALGAGVQAALLRDGVAESAHDAAGGALAESLETAADTLVVVNAGDTPAAWSAELLPLEARDRTAAISGAAPLVRDFAAAGTLRIAVAPDAGRGAPLRLRAAGAAAPPTYLAADGRILVGADLPVGSGGVLLLPHGRGLAAAWVERAGDATSGLWGSAPQPRERTVAAAGVVRLDGPSAALAVSAAAPSVLRLRTEVPLVGVLRRPGGDGENLLQLRAATLELYLPPGTTTLRVRPAAGAALSGTAEVLLSPVTALGEGPGAAVMLAPGTARHFSFTVTRDGPVGIGVLATPDTVSCRLLDASGAVLGEGIVQMPRLAPGTYLLAVSAPADGAPVSVRPALAGLTPPGDGPPDEVVRGYLKIAAGGPGGNDAGPRGEDADPEEGDR